MSRSTAQQDNNSGDSTMRLAHDALGDIEIPVSAMYGAATRRAELNFPISGRKMPDIFIKMLALIKGMAAKANYELNLIDKNIATAIEASALEIYNGQHLDQFPLDIYQTGSATSTNMNANEVIATLANKRLTNNKNSHETIHPNDHVNLGQSSNDAIPTATHLAILQQSSQLEAALTQAEDSLRKKAFELADILKIARTHLQDATPITMGQVFSGYAELVRQANNSLANANVSLATTLALGGTAVGTGINTHPEFSRLTIEFCAEYMQRELRVAREHVSAQSFPTAVLSYFSALKNSSLALMKIANDIRFLASGPRCGIGELTLPETQPGSSIMPGKVNPVMSEMLMQDCSSVIGSETAVTTAALALSQFELSVCWPMITWELAESIRILSNAINTFIERCIEGITANKSRCESLNRKSLMLATPLAKRVGYDLAAEVAKKAAASNRDLFDVALELTGLDEKTLHQILDPWTMVGTLSK